MRWGLAFCAALVACVNGRDAPPPAPPPAASASIASHLDAGTLMDDPRLYDRPY